MGKDLTTSNIDRQNILNNRLAIDAIREQLEVKTMYFNNKHYLTKQMVASFYEVEERTIERYIEQHLPELLSNGYFLSKGKSLKEFKLQFAPDINVGSKTTQLGLLQV